jgi:hypothetical protein
MSEAETQSRAAQQVEIRRLEERVQLAVRDGRIKFNPEPDARIRQQLWRSQQAQEQGLER